MTEPTPKRYFHKFFKGNPTQAIRDVGNNVYVEMISAEKGGKRERFIVTPTECDKHMEKREVASSSIEYLRTLVKK